MEYCGISIEKMDKIIDETYTDEKFVAIAKEMIRMAAEQKTKSKV